MKHMIGESLRSARIYNHRMRSSKRPRGSFYGRTFREISLILSEASRSHPHDSMGGRKRGDVLGIGSVE